MVFLVLSKLDYDNALLSGLSLDQLHKFQKVQNHAAKVSFKKTKNHHAMPLHWLPVKERIDYITSTLVVFKCINNSALQFLQELLHLKQNNFFSRDLRSKNDKALFFFLIPRSNLKSYGDRSVKYYEPHVWTSLPREIRNRDSLAQLKKHLKCHIF